MFRQIGDHSQAAGHVAIDGAITDGEFTFVACGKQERTEFVRHGHQEIAAHPRLYIFFCGIWLETFEMFLKGIVKSAHQSGNGNGLGWHAQELCQLVGVV
jgi:hypothetical protein